MKKEAKEFLAERETIRCEIKREFAVHAENVSKALARKLTDELQFPVNIVAFGADARYEPNEDCFYVSMFYKTNQNDQEMQHKNYRIRGRHITKELMSYRSIAVPEITLVGPFKTPESVWDTHEKATLTFSQLSNLFTRNLTQLRDYVKIDPFFEGKEVNAALYRDKEKVVGVVIQVNSDPQVLLGTATDTETAPYATRLAEVIGIKELREVVYNGRYNDIKDLPLYDSLMDDSFDHIRVSGWNTIQQITKEQAIIFADKLFTEITTEIDKMRTDAEAIEQMETMFPGVSNIALRCSNTLKLYYQGKMPDGCDAIFDAIENEYILVMARRTPMRVWMQVEPRLVEWLAATIDPLDNPTPEWITQGESNPAIL